MSVKEFWKSVFICKSYDQRSNGLVDFLLKHSFYASNNTKTEHKESSHLLYTQSAFIKSAIVSHTVSILVDFVHGMQKVSVNCRWDILLQYLNNTINFQQDSTEHTDASCMQQSPTARVALPEQARFIIRFNKLHFSISISPVSYTHLTLPTNREV